MYRKFILIMIQQHRGMFEVEIWFGVKLRRSFKLRSYSNVRLLGLVKTSRLTCPVAKKSRGKAVFI